MSATLDKLAYTTPEACRLLSIGPTTLYSLSKQGKLTLKVSEKGALSVYGMGRWPVTLYKSQWQRLLAAVPQIEAFLEAHAADLADKAE